jgi:hypothetical protein
MSPLLFAPVLLCIGDMSQLMTLPLARHLHNTEEIAVGIF